MPSDGIHRNLPQLYPAISKGIEIIERKGQVENEEHREREKGTCRKKRQRSVNLNGFQRNYEIF